jgi:hypothetical protein
LDHAHVVPAISDAADALLGEVPDKPGDVCFLRRRAPARDDSGELGRDLNKLVLEQGEAKLREAVSETSMWSGEGPNLERLAIDDETTVEFILQKVQLVLGFFSRLDYTSWSVPYIAK